MNFEKKKTHLHVFFTPYWIRGTKGYIANMVFEAANWCILPSQRWLEKEFGCWSPFPLKITSNKK